MDGTKHLSEKIEGVAFAAPSIPFGMGYRVY